MSYNEWLLKKCGVKDRYKVVMQNWAWFSSIWIARVMAGIHFRSLFIQFSLKKRLFSRHFSIFMIFHYSFSTTYMNTKSLAFLRVQLHGQRGSFILFNFCPHEQALIDHIVICQFLYIAKALNGLGMQWAVWSIPTPSPLNPYSIYFSHDCEFYFFVQLY